MEWHDSLTPSGLTLAQAQQNIYDFLLEMVKTRPPEEVLEEFRRLFIQYIDSANSEALPALHVILCSNNEVEFRHTLKRCCYILVNNWEVMRRFEFIQALVDLFTDPSLQQATLAPTLKRLRQWLGGFVASQDFADLRLFAARLAEDRTINRPGDWVNRYASYLLVPQYINEANPFEQRQAAR
ncbi:MAG TPA: hypothetical protein IGR64_00335, partial [Leptolyngbyaceae cyanobacterium M65_K2018_010]|nr:hypothetical protein [Leptolyngbyaceae cyanobacterium M65_K2018_010]